MSTGDLAFVGVTVLPMTGPGGPVVLEHQTVVVTDRRIASINPADEVQVGDDVEVIEAAGQLLQSVPAALVARVSQPQRIRKTDA